MPAEVDTMVSVRQVPWHGLGTIVEDKLTAAKALVEAGLDWTVDKKPLFLEDGTPVESKFATVREDTGDVLGVVGTKYEVLQNEAAFQFADALVDDGSAKYETAGSLRGGRTVWMMMTIPDQVKIAGEDEIDLYLALRNSHDGSSQVTAMATPVRIVCQNTLNLALTRARRTWSVRHIGLEGKLQEARRALDLTFEYMEEFEEVGNRLAGEKLSDRKFESIVAELTDVEKHAEGMIAAFKTSDNLDNYRNTKWGAVNAVGEYWEHLRDSRSDEATTLSTLNGQARNMRDRTLELVS